ncbi:MAG: dihydrofolate reductase family protein [Lewinellaceae bacterium]|nr:dihydrofolate reductase family protein [Saprospiraceae bacterium]MCB9332707.1 dihydrofolate reductase family protein [Lewinellaceae bacterium]
MRTLKLQVQTSIDGFIGGPNGELDWLTWNWDDALKNYVAALTEPIDCIVMGRNMAPGFIAHWTKAAENPGTPEYDFARKMTDTPKVVFTKTLAQSEWPNTVLAKGALADEIARIKQAPGSDIIAYGGAQFVGSLVAAGLIDELNLFVNPVILGNGLPIFSSVEQRQQLTLAEARAFEGGIVLLKYLKAG